MSCSRHPHLALSENLIIFRCCLNVQWKCNSPVSSVHFTCSRPLGPYTVYQKTFQWRTSSASRLLQQPVWLTHPHSPLGHEPTNTKQDRSCWFQDRSNELLARALSSSSYWTPQRPGAQRSAMLFPNRQGTRILSTFPDKLQRCPRWLEDRHTAAAN